MNTNVGLMALRNFGVYKTGDCLTGELNNDVYTVDGEVVVYGEDIIKLTEVQLGYFN